ncbi:MAG: NTP transferase domain-containing protein [Prevotella sp.]|nr:NTP transferase domain-containing protein [Prevotella sp.]
MKFAVIAAGEGSRLAAEGVHEPKPLVCVGHERLIDRLIRIFMVNNAEEIVVICNDKTAMVARHLVELQRNGLKGCPVPLRFVIKNTSSSMHSFFEICKFLQDGPFVLTTVDTVFREDAFSRFVKTFRQTSVDGLMGVTDYVDDEKPLYVKTDTEMNILSFLDEKEDCRFVSAGVYGLRDTAIYTLHNCIARGEQRMRNFQRALIAEGCQLRAYPLGKVFDIDHAADISKAEQFLNMENDE